MNFYRKYPSNHGILLADLLRDPELVTIRIDGRSLITRTGLSGLEFSEFFVPEEDSDDE